MTTLAAKPCFLNVPVDVGVQWPRKDSVVPFGRHEIIAFTPSSDHDPSLHLDLARSRLSNVEGGSVLNQFLSIAAWLDDTFALLLPGWSGNPVPCRSRRQTRSWPTSICDGWCNSWQPLPDEKGRRALAIYREAVNMWRFYSIPYAVLGFYKIVESAYPAGTQRDVQLQQEVERQLNSSSINIIELREIGFSQDSKPVDIAKFLYESGRHAVAHANKEPSINPDDSGHQRRMSVAASILRAAARSCIKSQFRIGTNRWDQNDLR